MLLRLWLGCSPWPQWRGTEKTESVVGERLASADLGGAQEWHRCLSVCLQWPLPQVVFTRQVTSVHSGQCLCSAVDPSVALGVVCPLCDGMTTAPWRGCGHSAQCMVDSAWGPKAWEPGTNAGQVCSWWSGLGSLQAPQGQLSLCIGAQTCLAPSRRSTQDASEPGQHQCWGPGHSQAYRGLSASLGARMPPFRWWELARPPH